MSFLTNVKCTYLEEIVDVVLPYSNNSISSPNSLLFLIIPPGSPHTVATGRLFCVLMSLLFSLNEHTFHTLAVVASGIQRFFANVVAILGQAKRQSRAPLKSVNAIQIDNLRPVDAHKVLFRSSFFIKSHDISVKFVTLQP